MPLSGTSQVACRRREETLSEEESLGTALRPVEEEGVVDRRLLTIPLLLSLLVAACGDAGAPPPTEAMVAETGSGSFPVTVESATGAVTIEARPERIVSLSATHTEMLYAMGAGDQVVGTDLTSNFPPETESTTRVDAFNFDVEEVAALSPDLAVLAFDFNGEVEQLGAAGIPVLLLPPAADVEEALAQMVAVGEATGHGEQAAALAAALQEEITEVIASTEVPEGTVIFHEVDNTYFSANSSTFIGDIYRRFGLVNIADDAPDEAGAGFPQLSEEYIIASDPDIVFLADAAFGETPELVAARPGWAAITAVRDDRVIALDGDVAGRWGPRTIDLVRQVAAAIALPVEG